MNLYFCEVQIPVEMFLVTNQMQFLFTLIPSDHIQCTVHSGSPLLLKKKCSVCAAQQTCGAGDHFKFIGGRLFAGVMHQQQTDIMLVSKGFQFANDFIITGIAVSLAAQLSDLL